MKLVGLRTFDLNEVITNIFQSKPGYLNYQYQFPVDYQFFIFTLFELKYSCIKSVRFRCCLEVQGTVCGVVSNFSVFHSPSPSQEMH